MLKIHSQFAQAIKDSISRTVKRVFVGLFIFSAFAMSVVFLISFYRNAPAVAGQVLGDTVHIAASAPPSGQLQFLQAQFSAMENSGVAIVSVARIGGSAGAVTVDYQTLDSTAHSGVDYTHVAGTLTFQDGETLKQFHVPLIDNAFMDGHKSITLELSNPTGGAVVRFENASNKIARGRRVWDFIKQWFMVLRVNAQATVVHADLVILDDETIAAPPPPANAIQNLPNYFHKPPAVFRVEPSVIEEGREVKFEGVGFYGTHNTTGDLITRFLGAIPTIELWGVAVPLQMDHNRDIGRLPWDSAEDLETQFFDEFDDKHFSYSGYERETVLDNPLRLIISNWDTTFTAIQNTFEINEQEAPMVKASAYGVQCYGFSLNQLEPQLPTVSPVGVSSLPPPMPSGAPQITVSKISPLPMIDICYFCNGETVIIDGVNFIHAAPAQGTVQFWSPLGWQNPLGIIQWTNTQIQVVTAGNIGFNRTECPRPGALNNPVSTMRLPIKICRAVPALSPEECAVWYGPQTHIKVDIHSGTAYRSYRAYSPTSRLNVWGDTLLAGANVVDLIKVDNTVPGISGHVALFINTLYNDVEGDFASGKLNAVLFAPASVNANESKGGLLLIEKDVRKTQEGFDLYTTQTYNVVNRYEECTDGPPCLDRDMMFPYETATNQVLLAPGYLTQEDMRFSAGQLDIFSVTYNKNDGYVVILGENFKAAVVEFDNSSRERFYPQDIHYSPVSSGEIHISVDDDYFSAGAHRVRVMNEDYGVANPGWSNSYYFECDLERCE